MKIVFDIFLLFLAGYPPISMFQCRQRLLTSSIRFLMFVFVGFVAQESLAQQTQSKIGDESPGSTTRTNVAKEPEAMGQEQRKPATVDEAAQTIDLSTFPLLPNVLETHARSVSRLKYVTDLKTFDVKSEYEFQLRNLLKRQWQELPNGEGQFTRSGFRLAVDVQPHDERGKAIVTLENLGNVNLSKLPVPSGAILTQNSHYVVSYETTANVKETRDLVRTLLIDQGWQPYGTRGDGMDMKQNAVVLTASVASTGQSGKTRIVYHTVQMSADLPVPPNSASILYESDYNRLELLTSGSLDEITSYYQTTLARWEWKVTTEKPIHDVNSQQMVLIFRNPAKDKLRLGMRELKQQRTRVTLKYQSAAEIDEADQMR